MHLEELLAMKASPFAEFDTEAQRTHAALERRVEELASGRPLKGFVVADEDDPRDRYPWERNADVEDAGGNDGTSA